MEEGAEGATGCAALLDDGSLGETGTDVVVTSGRRENTEEWKSLVEARRVERGRFCRNNEEGTAGF